MLILVLDFFFKLCSIFISKTELLVVHYTDGLKAKTDMDKNHKTHIGEGYLVTGVPGDRQRHFSLLTRDDVHPK